MPAARKNVYLYVCPAYLHLLGVLLFNAKPFVFRRAFAIFIASLSKLLFHRLIIH